MKRLFILAILLCVFSVASAQTRVILVRHAEKVMEGENPGLTAEGIARAEALAHVLSGTSVDALFSTPYNRTRETLVPLAKSTSLEIQEYPPVDREEIQRIVSAHKNETIVFSGHSNTIPMMVNLLSGKDTYKTFPEWQYDDLFILTLYDEHVEVIPLKYGRKSVAP